MLIPGYRLALMLLILQSLVPTRIAVAAGLIGGALLYLPAMGHEPATTPPKSEPEHDASVPELPVKVPACDSPEMADRLKSSFDSSDGARALNVSAAAVRDAAEVDPNSILAARLDRTVPVSTGANVAVYCKARIALNTAHTVSQVFRAEVQPTTGHESLIGSPIYDTDFDMPALSTKPPPPESPSASGVPKPPAPSPPMPPRAAPVLQGSILSQPALPAGTVLCTLEDQVSPPGSTRRSGLSCFRLVKPAPFVVINRTGAGHEQVRLTGGDHAGVTAWTGVSPVGE